MIEFLQKAFLVIAAIVFIICLPALITAPLFFLGLGIWVSILGESIGPAYFLIGAIYGVIYWISLDSWEKLNKGEECKI